MMPSEEWRNQHKKPCIDCGTMIKYISTRCVKCSGVQHRTTREQKKISGKIWRDKKLCEYKKKAFDKFGAFCSICGFNDPRALHIDHVNEDGNKERSRYRGSSYIKYKRFFEDTTGKYQVLCSNCNMIKSYKKIINGSQGKDCVFVKKERSLC